MFHFVDERLSVRGRLLLVAGTFSTFACVALLAGHYTHPYLFVATGLCFLVALALSWQVAQGLGKRIEIYYEILVRLSRGGEPQDVPYQDYRNEAGRIASALASLQQRFVGQATEDKKADGTYREAARALAAAEATVSQDEAAMRAVCNALGQVTAGNLSYRLADGVLPPAWRSMQEEFNRAVETVESSARTHDETASRHEAEMRASEEAHEEAAEAAHKRAADLVISTFGEGLAAMARRDLSYRMNHDMPEEFRILQDDFNNAISQLEDAMMEIDTRTADIATNAGEISKASQEMAQRTERQAAALEESAAALNEITSTVGKSAENAKQANETALSAKTDAEHGGDVAKRSVEAMHMIAKSSGEINQIIGVIDEIAFQTNLLAINAAVEAAHAGETGKGFAVVASEVRSLAQRSAEAAKKIKSLIRTSEEQVEQGVKLVEESGLALSKIVADVGAVSSLMGEISASQSEQAVALGQIDSAVEQMDQTTQQNAAMAEESTAASEALAGHSRDLATLVDRFETKKNTREDGKDTRPEKETLAA